MNTITNYLLDGSTVRLAAKALLAVLAFSAAYALVVLPLHYLFISPLRAYPGPKLWAASRIPLFLSQRSGYHYTKILQLHCRYGEIVRISPTELSYVQHNAWKEIMGRKKGQAENAKDPVLYKLNRASIVGSDYALHSQIRRILNHGFSTKSLLEQETLIRNHVDLFFERMKTRAATGEAVNIVAWYNFVTFDIIGDLAFGESFHCLEEGRFHPWVANIFNTMKSTALTYFARRLVYHADEIFMAVRPAAVRAFQKHQKFTASQVQKRLQVSQPRPDFFEAMLTKDGGAGERLSLKSMEANSGSLAIAGSETTATVLSFTTYLLCKHPEVLARVQAEVDGAFTSEAEINFTAVGHLTYMLGVLNEAMRLFPAAPETFARITPPEGAIICDRPVPGNTTVGIPQWAAYHYPENFEAASRFVPERWLPDTPFPNDRKDAFNPFSYGSRDCIGKNLAYNEMRVLLARMLFCFDIELDPRSQEWLKDMPCYLFWEKPKMYVHLRLRTRDAPKVVAPEAIAETSVTQATLS